MKYVIDRIESSIAVCEELETGSKAEFDVTKMPSFVKEGDVIRHEDDKFIIDDEATEERREMFKRFERLWK